MSASKKKKLRSDNAGKMTERQLAEQKEAKKVKFYSIAFGVVMAALVVVAVVVGVNRTIEGSGMHERNTIAATIGSHEISDAELSYYYMDTVNNFANTYGSYLSMTGIQASVPLDQQVLNPETGETWADNFVTESIASAQTIYALADEAAANGFTLPEEERQSLEVMGNNLDAYATIYGYKDADAFLKAQYGRGASKESYMAYYERNMLASAYQNFYQNGLTYSAEQIRELDAQNPAQYSSFSYNQYYVSVSKFLTGGTEGENGVKTYTDEEQAAASAAAEAAVAALTDSSITTAEQLDAAIAALSINEGTTAASTAYTNQAYTSMNSYVNEWMSDASRQAGDLTAIPVTTTSTDADGVETTKTTAYYVVMFNGVNTNEVNLVNARHILISFEGQAGEDGTYPEESKAAALAKAQEILDAWKAGDATEESFAALANEKSTDGGSNTNGGLYENIFPGQMVANFNDWCFDASRKTGDTDIVETNYGYHIMYFVGTANQTYRDYQITSTLRTNEMNEWFKALVEKYPIVNGDTTYVHTGITLG